MNRTKLLETSHKHFGTLTYLYEKPAEPMIEIMTAGEASIYLSGYEAIEEFKDEMPEILDRAAPHLNVEFDLAVNSLVDAIQRANDAGCIGDALKHMNENEEYREALNELQQRACLGF